MPSGLLPFVLIRSVVATFFARGDTATPVKAALIAAAVNIAFKVLLMGPLAQVGLALATSIGAWINLGLVIWFAARAGHMPRMTDACGSRFSARRRRRRAGGSVVAVPRAGCRMGSRTGTACVILPRSAMLAIIGAVVYGGIVVILFGGGWLAAFRGKSRR